MKRRPPERLEYYTAPMIHRVALLLLFVSPGVCAGGADEVPEPCSAAWNRYVEEKVISGDGQGHGPDPGSDEWKGVVEFKLGVRGQADVPARDSEAWCRYIDRLLRER